MISVCFRFDDPSATSDHKLEQEVFEIFARFDVPLCVATIPFARSPAGELVRLSTQNALHLLDASRAGVIEIAQHGHSHISRAPAGRRIRSEFAGLPASEQMRLIREGMEHLESVFDHRIKGFVPPWNSYDRVTAQALDEAGFQFLSIGKEVGQDLIRFGTLPVICGTGGLLRARPAIERAMCFQSLAPVQVVIFHPDDFEEFRSPPLPDEPPPFTNLRELEGLLGWIKASPNVRTETISRIAESVRHGTKLRTRSELNLPHRIQSLVPPMLARSGDWMTLPGVLWGALRSRYRFHS